jgi:hypothetical protein
MRTVVLAGLAIFGQPGEIMGQATNRWCVFLSAFLLVSCGSTPPTATEKPGASSQAAPAERTSESADLFVLNVSGATLFSSNQDITDNGSLIVSLPRGTYTSVRIAPGPHEFRFKAFPKGPRVATMNAETNRTYYLVVGYSPSRSWAFPFGGDPMTIKLVTEEDARNLMKEMKPQ